MFDVDHIPVWIPDRDAALQRLAAATGLPILDGYAPEGRRVARGIRFSNGPFLDVHQSDEAGPVRLALAGEVHAAETRAYEQDWSTHVRPRVDGQDAEPWSILSFGRGQGVLSRLFVIEYAEDETAWRSPVFNGGLYHLPPVSGPRLNRVWLTAADPAHGREVLLALNYAAAGEVESSAWPHRGRVFHGRRADVVLAEGEDAVVRVDVDYDGPLRLMDLGPRLTVAIGRER